MAASKKDGEARTTDLHMTGRVNTTVETKTEVVDHTEAAASRRPVEYAAELIDLGGGSTLITYGEPVGGHEPSENEDA